MYKRIIFSLLLIAYTITNNINAQVFNINDYGAVADGKTDNTAVLQKVIDKCSEKGGTVIIPLGKYLIRPVFLKSNVNLHLEFGASLLGDTDLREYHKAFPGAKGKRTPALIYARNEENIAITGLGTIDGQGWHKNFQHGNDALGGPLRPKIIYLVDCKNVKVQDITLTNSAYWTQDYEGCDGVMIKGVKVYSHANWNNDGLDIDSKNVVVSDCYIDCDDDALCFKSDRKDACENVVVTNCILKSNCNAIKFGTASLGGFRNITVSNCVIRSASEDRIRRWHINYPWMGVTDKSVISGIALEAVDGGIMDRIMVSDIVMSDVQTPILIRLGDRKRTFTKHVSIVRNISISNVIASSTSKVACSITGIPGNYVENVSVSNVLMNTLGGGKDSDMKQRVPENKDSYPENRMFGVILPASGFYLRHVRNIHFQNINLNTLNPDARPMLGMDDVENISFDNLKMNNKEFRVK